MLYVPFGGILKRKLLQMTYGSNSHTSNSRFGCVAVLTGTFIQPERWKL